MDGSKPEWLRVEQHEIQFRTCTEELDGLRIVHLSDIHCSRTVSKRYLERCVQRVNNLKADIIVLTGDYVTHDIQGRYRTMVASILGLLESKFGIYACMGNHDYGIDGLLSKKRTRQLALFSENLGENGVKVLINESKRIKIADDHLWIVGLGDIWAKDMDAEKAFRKIKDDKPVVALAHNPITAKYLTKHHYDLMLSGHTHGLPLQLAFSGSKSIVNKLDKHSGMYELGSRKLYVNRGLGRLGRAMFNTRPEITVFTITTKK